ncbi:MAG TPA: NAD(+) diphosphatase [Steroidobacteraceae bacterium]|nr:NAD(+) diphosphatase [Steroidobacteraceae bacterium]
MASENLFAGPYLDRRAEARLRENWLAEAQADPHTIYIAMRQGAALIHPSAAGASPRAAFLSGNDPRVAAAAQDAQRLVLLGWYQARRCLLVDLPPDQAVERDGEAFAELRPLTADLPDDEAGLLAYARALQLWRGTHRCCSRCGATMVSVRAGHLRCCPQCGYQSFPRLDPAIIVLVHDGNAALLGRQAAWQPGRYSTIAGFVEPGESLEDAVRREVFEETGIAPTDIAYHSSQPWPFPASLMLGFTARAAMAPPVLRDGELEDARWFSREELRDGAVQLPPATSISRRLIDGWLRHAA